MIVSLFAMALCSALNWVGGAYWHNARRYIMPVVLGAAFSIVTHVWWLGFTVLPSMGALTIGYGVNSPLRHIFGDAWARFVWMILVSIGICLGAVIAGHLIWWIAGLYMLTNATLGMTLRNIDQTFGDSIFGAAFASVLFFLH